MNKKGTALFFTLLIVVVLTILGATIVLRSISESRLAQRSLESTQAFWLAEAGVNRALKELKGDHHLAAGNNLFPTSLGAGQYNFDLTTDDSSGVWNYTVKARGFIPNGCNEDVWDNDPQNCNCHVVRTIQVVMNEYENIPPGFYDNAIYSAGNVSIGSNCPVNGNAISGGTITGTVESPWTQTSNEPTLHEEGLPLLDFAQLRQKSIDQGWYNPNTNVTTYPTSFWNVAPSPAHPIGTPNVVFVNGNFDIVGGKQVVGGFVVVGGDTIYNAEIGGNARVDGCVYTRGDIWLHGGGGNIVNVDGGIWAGGTVLLNGNEQIDYNQDYMNAIRESLHPNTDVQMKTWREKGNPYNNLNP